MDPAMTCTAQSLTIVAARRRVAAPSVRIRLSLITRTRLDIVILLYLYPIRCPQSVTTILMMGTTTVRRRTYRSVNQNTDLRKHM